MIKFLQSLIKFILSIVKSFFIYIASLVLIILICDFIPGMSTNSIDGHSQYTTFSVLIILFLPFIIAVFYFIRSNKSTAFKLPRGQSADERASDLLWEIQKLAIKINHSLSIEDFSEYITDLFSVSDELIWLNEKKRVKMTPSPRSEIEKIKNNMGATINDLIDRIMGLTVSCGEIRANDIDSLVSDLERNEIILCFLTPENVSKINYLKEESKRIRQDAFLKDEIRRKNALLGQAGLHPNIDLSNIDTMSVIQALERNIDTVYRNFYTNAESVQFGRSLYSSIETACKTSKFPLAAEIRLESLLPEYELKFHNPNPLTTVDSMEGHAFEHWCANLLSKNGFYDVQVTQASGDQGVDVIAEKDGIRYAIQCKCYSHDLGNGPVQEIHTGKYIYHCQVGAVMTNRYFTKGAKEAANATGVLLWDRDKLQELIESSKSLS